MRPVPIAFLVVVAFLAGCLQGTTPPVEDPEADLFDPEWALLALPFGDDHDHGDRTHHLDFTTPNFEIIGWDPLVSPHYGHTPAGYVCGDVQDTRDGRRLAAVESRSDLGFAIADVTDPAAPFWLGELLMPTTYVYDLAVVPDGKHLVLVTSQPVVPSLPAFDADLAPSVDAPRFTWRSACTPPEGVPVRWAADEDPVPRPVSLLLVDIQDPASPAIIDQRPLPGLGHSAFSVDLDGRLWILAASVGAQAVQHFQFYSLIDTPLGARLEHLSTYNTPLHTDDPPRAIGGHTDGWIAVHPLTEQTLAYLVGARDFVILDLADPRMPKELARWTDTVPGRTGPVAALHSVFPMRDLLDGRHYTVIGPEYGGHPDGQPSGNIWVIDTTDPTDVREVAAWTLPHEVDWSGTYMFSNHYLTVHGTTAFVSMYHGGVWALDLSVIDPDAFTLLPSIGVFLPTNESPLPPPTRFRWAPNLQEVLSFEDGTLVTFDSMSGVYTFRFDPTRPAPAPEPWPIEPVHR